MNYDLAIRGGTVIDGLGTPSRRADVGIAGGRIAEIGRSVTGVTELDATGAVVSPGFIDLHTHYDAQVLWDPWLTPSSLQGVTTVVAGSCGFSLAPCRPDMRPLMLRTLQFVEGMDLRTLEEGVTGGWETYAEYLKVISQLGTAINFGGYIGHTAVRLAVMGSDGYEREATPAELVAMQRLVSEGIEAGAIGFSTDRSPYHRAYDARRVPSAIGSQEEVVALMRSVGELGRGVCMAIVDPNDFEWVFDVQAAIGRSLNWCQLMTWPAEFPWAGATKLQLERQRAAAEGGAHIFAQATCKPITQQFTFANPIVFLPAPAFGELAQLTSEEKAARYRQDGWREHAQADLVASTVNPDWTKWVVAETERADLIGRTVADLARERGQSNLDTALEIALADQLETRFTVTSANDDFDELQSILTAEGAILGLSDAGAHCDQMCDANMLTDFLAHWVRDRELMPLEQGVRKVSAEPAQVLELGDRGTLQIGKAADIAVWDLEALDPGPIRRVTDFPAGGTRLIADRPKGFRHVLVNGIPIRRDTESLLGQLSDLPGQIVHSENQRRESGG